MKVYIFGPITIDGADYLPVYKHLTELCKPFFDTIICTYPDFWQTKDTPREFYDRTYNEITDCDLFIADVSSASFGVGMELQMGAEHNIPVIALCKNGAKLSAMVKGLPNLRTVVYYSDLEDLSIKVLEKLKDFKYV